MKHVAIAIDGPAAAGKSTVAKIVAKRLGFVYIDTGAMYRAFTWYVLHRGLDPKNEEASCSLIPEVRISLKEDGSVFVCGHDVTRAIREPLVSSNVSYIASYKGIRLALIDLQRELGEKDNCVMDGRDIGSYVLPHAEVKIFQIASVETRAKRRFLENQEKGIPTTYEEVVADVKNRDYIDSHRDFDPLMQAEDAIPLDTSDMTIEEVVDAILRIVEEKTGVKACR
ncbi:MAG: (d)CMP kinase [Bacillales bacterium]|nr:(d)CMP kinase [Bacillales bacterium]MDY5919712.1 (d)CMP kinase [Candidatus Enteromonas sp.]